MLNRQKNSLFGSAMLVLCAFVWGFAFVAQSSASASMSAVAFNGLRFAEALVVLGIVIFVVDSVKKSRGHEVTKFTKETVLGGIICGVSLLFASNLQQYAIGSTSVGKASFITVLYIVIVPIMSLFLKKRPSVFCRFAILIAFAGFYLMCVSDGFSLTQADVVLLFCSVGFSFQMTFIDLFSKDSDPLKLTLIQFITCTLLSLPLMGIFGFPTGAEIKGSIFELLYVGVCSAGIGITLQTIGQKHTDGAVATLIMSLESIIGTIGGIIILHEVYTFKELAGCLLVFIAIFLAEYRIPHRFLQFERNNFALTERDLNFYIDSIRSAFKNRSHSDRHQK